MVNGVTNPNILANIQAGLALREQFESREPRRQAQSLQLQTARDQARLNSIVQGARQLKNITTPEGKIDFLQNRRSELQTAGLGTQDTDEALQLAQAGRFDELEQITDRAINAGQKIQTDIQQAQQVPGLGFITLARGGDVSLQQLPPEQRQIVQQALEQEATRKAQAAGLTTEAKEAAKQESAAGRASETARGKGFEKRRQESVNLGISAAKGIPVLKRSIALLDSIKTGGFSAVLFKAKQLFGVEGADEGELSANLGRAVLGQLRSIFGAAFTEREGKRLERIEAGFGKSPVANKRLLGNLFDLAEKEAKLGIKAAVDAGDFRAASDIQEFLDFELGQETLKPIDVNQPQTTQAAPQKFTSNLGIEFKVE